LRVTLLFAMLAFSLYQQWPYIITRDLCTELSITIVTGSYSSPSPFNIITRINSCCISTSVAANFWVIDRISFKYCSVFRWSSFTWNDLLSSLSSC
jgi:hypothetical protein